MIKFIKTPLILRVALVFIAFLIFCLIVLSEKRQLSPSEILIELNKNPQVRKFLISRQGVNDGEGFERFLRAIDGLQRDGSKITKSQFIRLSGTPNEIQRLGDGYNRYVYHYVLANKFTTVEMTAKNEEITDLFRFEDIDGRSQTQH